MRSSSQDHTRRRTRECNRLSLGQVSERVMSHRSRRVPSSKTPMISPTGRRHLVTNRNGKRHILEDLQKSWAQPPACSSIAVIFWPRCRAKLARDERQAVALINSTLLVKATIVPDQRLLKLVGLGYIKLVQIPCSFRSVLRPRFWDLVAVLHNLHVRQNHVPKPRLVMAKADQTRVQIFM